MKNKGLIIALAVVLTALCLYYLSFTYASMNVQQNAMAHATDKDGIVNLNRKQAYLDSVWNLPVYQFLGTKYTYKEVKDNELSLGLDLQGGMHVTLEVSPVEIIKGLSGNSQDPSFQSAVTEALRLQQTEQKNFSALFYDAYKKANPARKLSSIFANSSTRGRIAIDDSDEAVMAIIDAEIENAIERSFTILRNRIDQFGTSQPNIQRLPGSGRIQIEIPGADNPQRVRKLLQGVARLEFWDVADPNAINTSLLSINNLLLQEQKELPEQNQKRIDNADNLSDLLGDTTRQQAKTGKEKGSGLDSLQQTGMSSLFSLSTAPGVFRYRISDTAVINTIFKRPDVLRLLPPTISVYWGNKPQTDRQGNEAMELFFLEVGRNRKARLTGEVITDARSTLDETANPAVSMTMNATGTRVWSKWTAEASSKSPKGQIAIVLDNAVYSAPMVNGEIPNGNSQIAGNFTPEEAKDLANILKAGSLPAPTRIVEEAIVGPTLGKVAQEQGFISMACGLVLVVVFMIGYYGKGGWVANIALLFNVFFILGILSQLDAALTLPGIAGVVLTMGMAVDANVIIYERIREEIRQGTRLREAINRGFRRSFWTIFDSNITTFLTALMLYFFGQGPVKGFAITLMVGIVTTFFTAVYISRLLIVQMIQRRGDESTISFKTFMSNRDASRLNIDFVGKRRIAYVFSAIIIASGICLMAIQGLNMGVDFTGGRSFIITFSKPVVATDMKVALTERFENAGTEVKNYGSNNVMKVTTSYLIHDDSEKADEKVKTTLIDGIEQFSGLQYEPADTGDNYFSISSSSKVGATIANDIKVASIESALLALAAIFLYILMRFSKWQFSLGAIISLAHDALFVFAAFAIARLLGISFEIDQVFVAAILTVIGYSINDTVIIFDRIREYQMAGTGHDQGRILNNAINSTLNRTIITSGTTLLVVLALFFFGGEVLRGFSFALLVGIGIGTYSSVFIAAPMILDLAEKKETHTPVKQKYQTVKP